MDNGSYVAFLIIGIVLIAVDGQFVYRSGLRYLANSYTERDSAVSMARLIAVMFHLVTLGVLALISVIDFSAGNEAETVVLRVGIALLVLAAAHGITIAILNRMRDRLDAEELTMERAEQRIENQQAVRPAVAGQPVQPGTGPATGSVTAPVAKSAPRPAGTPVTAPAPRSAPGGPAAPPVAPPVTPTAPANPAVPANAPVTGNVPAAGHAPVAGNAAAAPEPAAPLHERGNYR